MQHPFETNTEESEENNQQQFCSSYIPCFDFFFVLISLFLLGIWSTEIFSPVFAIIQRRGKNRRTKSQRKKQNEKKKKKNTVFIFWGQRRVRGWSSRRVDHVSGGGIYSGFANASQNRASCSVYLRFCHSSFEFCKITL